MEDSPAVITYAQLSGWSRVVEVSTYADAHGLTPAEAIEALVNAGLSHLRPGELTNTQRL
jgi:hypothetical protein